MQKIIKKIIGCWDLRRASPRLGAALTFHEELLLQRSLLGNLDIEIYYLYENAPLNCAYFPSLVQLNPFITGVHFLADSLFKINNDMENILLWPPLDKIHMSSYVDSTLLVQELWRRSGALIDFMPLPFWKNKAEQWINAHLGSAQFVAVHLKNNPNDPKSNANQEAWSLFFNRIYKKYRNLKFVLIGSDSLQPDISENPNVVLTKVHGGNLDLDFALIDRSILFMGMSSGPCNFALFGNHPYLIWKHPGHHSKEMKKEFNGNKQFVFANERQQFFINWDTTENLITEFEKILTLIK